MIEAYGNFAVSDLTLTVLFPTDEIPIGSKTLKVPAWRLDDRIIYLIDHFAYDKRILYFLVRMI
jgi:hypothetical protein